MAPQNSFTIDAEYPLYAAQFTDENTLIVTGGGGEGKNGIPNKITSVSVDADSATPLKITGDYEFPNEVDSPTSLAYAKGTILVSANESSKNVKAGNNKSLRKFEFSGLVDEDEKKDLFKAQSAVDLFKSKDPNDYVKIVVVSSDGSVAAAVSSQAASTLCVINPETFEVIETIEEDKEIRDIAISPDGKKIAYVTDQNLTCLQDGEALTLTYNKFTSNYTLTKIEFASDESMIIGVNLKNKAGVLLLESRITTDEDTKEPILKTVKARVFSDKFLKITGMAVSKELVACIGNDNSMTIVNIKDFSVCKRLEKVHTFAITKVVFSPSGKVIASVSAANTINIYKVPDNIAQTYTQYYWALFFLILSLSFYYVYENVPRERFLAVTAYLDELFDGEVITRDDPRFTEYFGGVTTIEGTNTATEEASTTTEEETVVAETSVVVEETKIVVVETSIVENGDEVKAVTQSVVVDEEILSKNLEEKISSLL